jgi:hypothetical protein
MENICAYPTPDDDIVEGLVQKFIDCRSHRRSGNNGGWSLKDVALADSSGLDIHGTCSEFDSVSSINKG